MRHEADLPNAIGFSCRYGLSGRLNAGDALSMRRPDFELARDARPQCAGDGSAVLPGCVDFDIPASAKSAEVAFRPRRGQCGKECDDSGVALQEHFGDAGSRAEVGVDLEEPASAVQQALGAGG